MIRCGNTREREAKVINFLIAKIQWVQLIVLSLDVLIATAKLKKWEKTVCEEAGHENLLKKNCSCEPPYRLYMFPSSQRNGEKREAWIRLIKRETKKKRHRGLLVPAIEFVATIL